MRSSPSQGDLCTGASSLARSATEAGAIELLCDALAAASQEQAAGAASEDVKAAAAEEAKAAVARTSRPPSSQPCPTVPHAFGHLIFTLLFIFHLSPLHGQLVLHLSPVLRLLRGQCGGACRHHITPSGMCVHIPAAFHTHCFIILCTQAPAPTLHSTVTASHLFHPPFFIRSRPLCLRSASAPPLLRLRPASSPFPLYNRSASAPPPLRRAPASASAPSS